MAMSTKAMLHLIRVRDIITKELAEGVDACLIIAWMAGNHGAKFDTSGSTNVLRCAGITGTCTTSAHDGLLASWRRCAERRIALEQSL